MSLSSVLPSVSQAPLPIPVRTERARPERAPVFLPVQASCLTCNEEIRDPLARELLGRFCSQRCLHAHGLPSLLGLGA